MVDYNYPIMGDGHIECEISYSLREDNTADAFYTEPGFGKLMHQRVYPQPDARVETVSVAPVLKARKDPFDRALIKEGIPLSFPLRWVQFAMKVDDARPDLKGSFQGVIPEGDYNSAAALIQKESKKPLKEGDLEETLVVAR